MIDTLNYGDWIKKGEADLHNVRPAACKIPVVITFSVSHPITIFITNNHWHKYQVYEFGIDCFTRNGFEDSIFILAEINIFIHHISFHRYGFIIDFGTCDSYPWHYIPEILHTGLNIEFISFQQRIVSK